MINISYVVKIDGEVQIKQFQVIRGVPDGLTTEMLLNRDEIVHDIITNRLSDNEKIYFRNATDETLSMEHMGMGMWMRNSYGLWETKNNPLVDENASANSRMHPDNLSFKIMELVRQALGGEKTTDPEEPITEIFDKAIKVVGEV